MLNLNGNLKISKFEKKLNKLKKNPDLFFQDMISNTRENIQLKFLKTNKDKKDITSNFTIVSAIYNVEKYLDEFFNSIVSQSINFKSSIQIICVDDGSIDNSEKIIKAWVKKYPKNIQYIFKKNGGQASARNLGLKNVKTEWVTFMDPDDIISQNYFNEIDNFIFENPSLDLISLPMAIYNEKNKTYHYDRFPLAYCYSENKKIVDADKMNNNIQLSVCNAIFKTKIIKENFLEFNIDIKPNFEDGKFALDYIKKSKKVGYLNGEYYFYRVREDNSSTTNGQWSKKEKYSNVIEFGFIDLLKSYDGKVIPLNVQRTFLYFAIQYLKNIINNPNLIDFLSQEEKNKFKKLFFSCFKYIDNNNIMNFHLLGCDYFYKYAMISGIKNKEINLKMLYVQKIDVENKKIIIKFYTKKNEVLDVKIDGKYVLPEALKIVPVKFLDDDLFYENKIFINFHDENKTIQFISSVSNKIIVKHGKKEFGDIINLNDISQSIIKKNNNQFNNWLFMDKDYKADDNAEHFYRYMKNNNNNNNKLYFALNNDSQDWQRLEKEGFNLVDFKSIEFSEILNKSEVVLSSQADKYFIEYNGKDTLLGKKFIFLQHGVIGTNISTWLNGLSKIDCFITSTQDEYNYISGENSPYNFTENNTFLTGLARHDSLFTKSKLVSEKNEIIIMPTWRSSFVGELKNNSAKRSINHKFLESDYFSHWSKFITSKKLLELHNKFGVNFKFIPHPNIIDYLSFFNFPEYIDVVIPNENYSYQMAFLEAKALITDYSSVAFDMAFLNKPTFYYLFDINDNKSHSSKKGYFDYFNHGFGPAEVNSKALFLELENYLFNNYKLDSIYSDRLNDAFKFRDGFNCKRIFDSIGTTFNREVYKLNDKNLIKYINFSSKGALVDYCNYYLSNGYSQNKTFVSKKLGQQYVLDKNWSMLKNHLKNYYDCELDIELKNNLKDWKGVVVVGEKYKINNLLLLNAYLRLDYSAKFNNLYLDLVKKSNGNDLKILEIFKLYMDKKWFDCDISILNFLRNNNMLTLCLSDKFCLNLLRAVCLRNLRKFEDAKNIINSIRVDENDELFLIEKFKIQYEVGNFSSSLYWFNLMSVNKNWKLIKPELISLYIKCLLANSDWKLAKIRMKDLIVNGRVDISAFKYYFKILFNLNQWLEIIEFFNKYKLSLNDDFKMYIVMAYYRLGDIDKASKIMIKPTYKDDFNYWKLCLEISMQIEDHDLEKHCCKSMIAIFPDKISEFHLFRKKLLDAMI